MPFLPGGLLRPLNMTFTVLDCLEVADCMNRPVAVIFRARATSIQRVQRTNAADT
jgi:hypothetical protein